MSFGNLFASPKKKDTQISTDIRKYFTKDLDYYVVPDGVTSIRSYAFYNFWPEGELVVKLPSTLTYIAPYAFSECAVKEVFIPGSVKNIDDFAFFGAALERVVFEDGIERIGEGAFMYGPLIRNVVIPDSVKYIGKDAFSGMDFKDGGATIEIGEGIEFIGIGAFESPIEHITIHRKYGGIADGSSTYYNSEGNLVEPIWYGGYTNNPIAVWDGER
ncbi:MAG: leucine-rich repeat domain-containing protein [Selenomonas sp.]|nr:leucine-rich repeat domain-containing protein [Selenomonas sp.]